MISNFKFSGPESILPEPPNPATALAKALEDPFDNGNAEILEYFAQDGMLEKHAGSWGASGKKILELKERLARARQKLAH